jgi:hypothetical protein
MMLRSVGAAVVLFVLGGFVIAETYRGSLVKLEDDKVTVRVFNKEDKKATEKTFKVNKDTKYVQKAKDKDGEDKVLKAEDVKTLIEKAGKGGDKGDKGGKGKGRGGRGGAFATIETTGEGDAETVKSITFGGMRRKGKGKDTN